MARRQNFQTISWFNDLFERQRLELDPPYQRRSVWSQAFKDYFVETILLSYPAPAIFLHEEITAEGRSIYNVVDGKQRFPRSISLLQFVFGVLAKSHTINPPFFKYYPVVTRELIELYPSVANFERTFNFNG